MAYEAFIGLRHLMAKRRGDVLSVITLISVAGVAVGVMAMIVVLSVMGGFENDLKVKIMGTKTHIVVTSDGDDYLAGADRLLTEIRAVDGVIGAAPFVQSEVMISSPTNISGVVIKGIDPKLASQVTDLERNLVDGDLTYLESAAKIRPGRRGLSDPEELDKILDELEQSYDLDALPGGDGGVYKPGVDGRVFRGKDGRPVIDQGASEDFRRRFVISDDTDKPGSTPSVWRDQPPPGVAARYVDDPPDGYMPPLPGQALAGPKKPESDVAVAKEAANPYGDDPRDGFMPPLPGQRPPTVTRSPPPARRDVPGIIIGRELKKTLQVEVGSELNVVSPYGDIGPSGPIPKARPFKVVGIFYSGMYEYDTKFVYMSIPAAQRFINQPGKVSGIEVKTSDIDRVREIRDAMRRRLGANAALGPLEVQDWRDLNSSLFAALELEKIVMFIILVFIILVASFSIVCNLVMMVLEKAREIAIIKGMGATDGGVMRMFMFEGTLIGVLGTLVGLILGIALCLVIEFYGIELDPDVYYINTLPVLMSVGEITAISVAGVLASVGATIYPAIQAARLAPVEGLRYE